MIGTAYNRNILHRLGDAWQALKQAPAQPGQLYPAQSSVPTSYLTFPGWAELESRGPNNNADEQRVRQAVQSTSVYSDMQTIANELSAAELVVKERKGDKLEDVENHPLEILWESPNEHMGRSFVMAYWAWSYTMASKAYLYWMPVGGELKEVWPIPPFMVTPVPHVKDFISGYLFKSRPDAKPLFISREYVTYSHSVNLFDIRDGMAFLVAAMTAIKSEIKMGDWNLNFFEEQNGVPDGLITIAKDTLDTDLARVRMELRDFFGGTRRGVAVARAGEMDYKPFGRSQKEIEFKEGMLLTSRQIDRAMGFPEGYWSETANKANAEQARASMIAGAVWPLLVALHEDMNRGVVKRWYGKQYRTEFRDIRPENREMKLKETETRKAYWTINELREADGKDPLDDPRGLMFIAELEKGVPLPATEASAQTEEYLAEQEAMVGDGEEEDAVVDEGAADATDAGMLPEAEGEPMPEPAKSVRADPRADERRKWERKALKQWKRFGWASVKFDATYLPIAEQEQIAEALKAATSADDIRAAFKADDDTDALITGEWDAAAAWAAQAIEGE
jgi:phage portal protein BeeE